MDVPLASPNIDPIGPFGLDHWNETPQKAFHFTFTCLAAGWVLVALPFLHRRMALRMGVLTPWELLKLVCGVGCDDPNFQLAGRVTVGMHHLHLDETDVELPRGLPAGAFYHGVAPKYVSLLPQRDPA